MINCLEYPKRIPRNPERRQRQIQREIAEMEKLRRYIDQLITELEREK